MVRDLRKRERQIEGGRLDTDRLEVYNKTIENE